VEPPPALPQFAHINRYWDKTHDVFMAKILPGEFYVTLRGEGVTTVLGSCISACVRDRKLGVGGMNHFMLPANRHDGGLENGALPTEANRYGNYAMEALINEILKAGGRREHLEIKIAGGGRILENMTNVGQMNIDFVRHYIHTEGLQLLGEDVGDIFPRKVVYFPADGRVRVKKLRALHNNTIIERETRYGRALQEGTVGGDVELF
jgi:chemotaxis protein CheD